MTWRTTDDWSWPRKHRLISKEDRLTLGAIAYVRNQFAHKTENLGSSLHRFFDSRTPDKKAELLNDLIQLEGNQNAKATDDMSRQGQHFRWHIFMCALRPLQAIATIGLNADAKAAEIKEWTLADLWASEAQAPERLAMVSRYVFDASKDIQRYQVPENFLPDQKE